MKYRYFYQTKENENREGWVSAKNRAEAYAALRKQGIRPYRVVGDDPIRWQPWAVGALIVALVLGIVVLLVTGGGPGDDAPVRRCQLTGDPAVIANGLSCDWANVFPSVLDRYLAAYAQPGRIAIPPEVSAEEIAAFTAELERPAPDIAVNDGAEVRQLKRIVALLRGEMRNYLAAGGTPQDYLAFLEARQEEEILFRTQAIESILRTPAALRDRVRMDMNLRMRERGLLELTE